MRTQVGIVGAGPAGLTLGAAARARGDRVGDPRGPQPRVRRGTGSAPACSSRASPTCSARPASASGWRARGSSTTGSSSSSTASGTAIDFDELTGKAIVIYGQTEVVKDLIAARLESQLPLLFEVSDVACQTSSRAPTIRFRHDGARADARVRPDRRLRRLPRRLPPVDPGRRAARVLARVPLRLARDPRRGRAVDRRARLLRTTSAASRCSACARPSSRATTSSAPRTRTSSEWSDERDLGGAPGARRARRAGRSRKARSSRRA